ncbi:MAG TPA: alpha-amylase family glycosyl hydrolase [Euzebyales bacterium]
MSGPQWWRDAVLYQIYPRSWADGNGDGIGDLPGITARLDHLAWLGVDGLWLSPIYPSPMADFGYDVADHTDVHPDFGTLADLDALVAAAHERDLRVILDFVPNHTSDGHAWFRASRSSRDDPRRDWYVWRDPAPDGGPPNNWMSRFGGGPAWTFDEPTGQWYLHTFLPEQPDLNWRNPEVRRAMCDVLRFWMRRGVDGFRVDVAHRIVKDERLRDNPPDPDHRDGMPGYRRVTEHYSRNWHEVHEIHRLLRRTVEEFDDPPRLLAGEVNLDPPELVAYYGDDDELHLPLNFHTIVDLSWTATDLAGLVDDVEDTTPAFAWPSWILSNHDKSRFPTRTGRRFARQALVFLLTARGTAVLYYGDELAMGDADVPPDRMQDPWGRHVPDESRDPERTPMPWDGSPNAGFCPPDVTPWLPLTDDAMTRNVDAQCDDPASELHLVRDLLSLRRARSSLRTGAYERLHVDDTVFAYVRRDGDEHTVVAMSFADAPRTLTLGGQHDVLRSTDADRTGSVGGELWLGPCEAVVLAAGD